MYLGISSVSSTIPNHISVGGALLILDYGTQHVRFWGSLSVGGLVDHLPLCAFLDIAHVKQNKVVIQICYIFL